MLSIVTLLTACSQDEKSEEYPNKPIDLIVVYDTATDL